MVAPWIWPVAIAAVGIGTYWGTLHNDFAIDDRIVVQNNARQWQNDGLWSLLKRDYWGDRRMDLLYRPVTMLSYVLNYRVGGERPDGFRAVNIALHVVCCLCLYGLTLAVFGDRRLAGVSGLLFAVHALHVEAVAQIVGRAELLAAVMALGALWVYVVEVQRNKSRPSWRYAAALILSLGAMLSKESGMTVVGLAVFYDIGWMRWGGQQAGRGAEARAFKRGPLVRMLQRWAGFLLVVMVVLTIRFEVLGRVSRSSQDVPKADNPMAQAGPVARVLTPFVLLGKCAQLLVWPDPLCSDYSYNALPVGLSTLDPRVLGGMLCSAALVAVGWTSYVRKGRALWCVGFFAITYAIVSNTFVLIGTIFAERLIYLPSVAFCWMVGLGVLGAGDWVSRRMGSSHAGEFVAALLILAIVAGHGVRASARGRVWRSEETLVAADVKVHPNSVRLRMQAGAMCMRRNDPVAAIEEFRLVVAILDDYLQGHYQLGRAYLLVKNPQEAIAHLTRCYGRLPPEVDAELAYDLGRAYWELNQPAVAASWFARADKHQPDSPQILAAWVQAVVRLGDRQQAVELLQRALSVTPPTHRLHEGLKRQLDGIQKTPATGGPTQ